MYSKIFKFNPYHDRYGKFTTPGRATFVSINPKYPKAGRTPLGLKAKEFNQRMKEASYDDEYEVQDHLLSLYSEMLDHPGADAVRAYSGSWYSAINSHLRFGEDVGDKTKRYIKEMDQFFKDAPKLDRDIIVKRGISVSEGSLFDKMLQKGAYFRDDGFMSTSIAEGFDSTYTMHILVKKGTPGAYIERISEIPSEKEFLLPRGAHLKIHRRSDAKKTIYAEVLI